MNSLEGKTVVLTGATGFIGSHLRRRLKDMNLGKLVLIARKPQHGAGNSEVWVHSAIEALTRDAWLNSGVDHVDIVFHLGAFTPKSGATADSFDESIGSNVLGTRALLKSLPNVPERFIFSSTLDVYAPAPEGQLLTEDSPIAPRSLYGASKYFCEHMVNAYARETRCATAILRYGHIYGPGEGAYAKLIPATISALLKNETPAVWGDGSVLRDFLFVDDAVEATVRAASSALVLAGPVNVVSGTSRPVRDIVEFLAGLSEGSGSIQYLAEKPGGRSLRFSAVRMRQCLGEWTLVSLEEGLAREFTEAAAQFRDDQKSRP